MTERRPFAALVQETRRLAILQLLDSASEYQASDALIYQALPGVGLAASMDVVRTEIEWLREQGLVVTEVVGRTSMARITLRGIDVALGRASVPGVARPDPS